MNNGDLLLLYYALEEWNTIQSKVSDIKTCNKCKHVPHQQLWHCDIVARRTSSNHYPSWGPQRAAAMSSLKKTVGTKKCQIFHNPSLKTIYDIFHVCFSRAVFWIDAYFSISRLRDRTSSSRVTSQSDELFLGREGSTVGKDAWRSG